MKNVAIFASGSGTNAENIVRYFSKSETIKVAVVLSNNRNVGVHARVKPYAESGEGMERICFICSLPGSDLPV